MTPSPEGDAVRGSSQDSAVDGVGGMGGSGGTNGGADGSEPVDASAESAADGPVDSAITLVDCTVGQCKRVFLSSTQTMSGNLGGVAGGDSVCQSLANARTLGGVWKAWLSDQSSSPMTRFSHAGVPYRLLDGTLVAAHWNALTSGALAHAIDVDETGNRVSADGGPGALISEVWTGTLPSGGYASASCRNWANGSSNMPYGEVGLFANSDFQWTASYAQFCDRMFLRLYCFEQ
jgi:hypothetical protein